MKKRTTSYLIRRYKDHGYDLYVPYNGPYPNDQHVTYSYIGLNEIYHRRGYARYPKIRLGQEVYVITYTHKIVKTKITCIETVGPPDQGYDTLYHIDGVTFFGDSNVDADGIYLNISDAKKALARYKLHYPRPFISEPIRL